MVAQQKKGNALFKLIRQLAAMQFFSRQLAGNLVHFDKLLLKLTANKHSFTSLLSGLPVVVLITTGAKTGLLRTSPLVALFEGEKVILIASSFGNARHPAWYYNLKANPRVKLLREGISGIYLAHEVDGEEREYYWQKAVQLYFGFARYQIWAGNRKIPILSLEPI